MPVILVHTGSIDSESISKESGMERQDAPSAKWWQLAFGVLCMAMIANLQYGWTLFVDPIDAKFHWGRAAIQFAFTSFVATETWLVPIEAWFVDRYGPRIVVCFGGFMVRLVRGF